MFKLAAHLHSLNRKMYTITHLPTLFEYYSALHLTQLYKKPFYVYNNVSSSHKTQFGFPICDKGVDLVDEQFSHIVQVKYYKEDRYIGYGKLSTFLATPILVNNNHLQLSLVRTNHSKLSTDIQDIITRGQLKDITLCNKDFLKYITY